MRKSELLDNVRKYCFATEHQQSLMTNERLLIGVVVLSLSNRASPFLEVFFVAWNLDYIF